MQPRGTPNFAAEDTADLTLAGAKRFSDLGLRNPKTATGISRA